MPFEDPSAKIQIPKRNRSFLRAFTLVEMIIVLGIIGVIMNLSFGTAYSSISSQQMVQSSRDLIQDVRLSRIQAMNPQRNPTEKWVHGVGLDISELGSKGRYIVFQLIDRPPLTAGGTSFTPFPAAPVFGLYTEDAVTGNILGSSSTGRRKPFAEKFPIVLTMNRNAGSVTRRCDNDDQKRIDIILFQSLNGRVRLYKATNTATPDPNQVNTYVELLDCKQAVITLRAIMKQISEDGD